METSKIIQTWKLILGLFVGLLVIYVGLQALPIYTAYLQFQTNVNSQGRIVRVDERYANPVSDLIYRHAQRFHIPIDRKNVKVEMDPAGIRISADYSAPIDLFFIQPSIPVHIQYPEDKQASSAGKFRLVSFIGLIYFLGWFFKGLSIFRKYRFIADTPLTPIRSVAMGLAQVRGKAVGERTLLSPVSRLPCFLYKVNIERWLGKGGWSPYLTDAAWVSFCLEDETGRIKVAPRGAEFDLEQTGRREVNKQSASFLEDDSETERRPEIAPGSYTSDMELREYVARVAAGTPTALFQGADLSSPANFESQQSKSGSGMIPGLRSPLFTNLLTKTGSLADGYGHSAGDYRLTEQCIQPEDSYDVIGTCAEDAGTKGAPERHIIIKGSNAPTLLISNRSDKAIVGNLRAQAMRYIFGGGALAIGFAAGLLQSLGLL